MSEIDDAALQDLYIWVDKIPLSRPKRNISRDFSDGVLMAEFIKYFFPSYVDLHNFPTCNSFELKKKNWQLLNWKVFKKLNFELSDDVIDNLVAAKPGVIEKVILLLRTKFDRMGLESKPKLFEQKTEEEKRPIKNVPMSPTTNSLTRKSPSLQNISVYPKIKAPKPLTKHYVSSESQKSSLTLASDSVPRLLYEEKVQECLALEETIEILNAKVRRMDHLISLKDIKVDELQNELMLIQRKFRN